MNERKKVEDSRKKQLGDGINKKILDKGRMINRQKREQMRKREQKHK